MWLKSLHLAAFAALFALPTLTLTACNDDSPDDLDDVGERIEEGFKDTGRKIEDVVD